MLNTTTYSAFFFPQVHTAPFESSSSEASSNYRGRSFLSFDNADSIMEDDELSMFTTTTVASMSSFFPSSASSGSRRPGPPTIKTHHHHPSHSSSRSSLRHLPSAKPAPRTIPPPLPTPTVPSSAPPFRTEYSHPYMPTRPYTTPSKPKAKLPPRPQGRPPSPPSALLQLARKTSTSTVSTHYRIDKRAGALAYLEGRHPYALAKHEPLLEPIPATGRSFGPFWDSSDEEQYSEGGNEDEDEEDNTLSLPHVSILPLSKPKPKGGRRRNTLTKPKLSPESSPKSIPTPVPSPIPKAPTPTRTRSTTIDSLSVGPAPPSEEADFTTNLSLIPPSPTSSYFFSPSPSPVPSVSSHSDDSVASVSKTRATKGVVVKGRKMVRRSQGFVDFEDAVDPRMSFTGKDGAEDYDAWAVVGERKPSWLKNVLV